MSMHRKTRYDVFCFANVMWDYGKKAWIRMDDPTYGRHPHKGYSSHHHARTLKRAIALCRALDQILEPGKDIHVTRWHWAGKNRWAQDMTFRRSQN